MREEQVLVDIATSGRRIQDFVEDRRFSHFRVNPRIASTSLLRKIGTAQSCNDRGETSSDVFAPGEKSLLLRAWESAQLLGCLDSSVQSAVYARLDQTIWTWCVLHVIVCLLVLFKMNHLSELDSPISQSSAGSTGDKDSLFRRHRLGQVSCHE